MQPCTDNICLLLFRYPLRLTKAANPAAPHTRPAGQPGCRSTSCQEGWGWVCSAKPCLIHLRLQFLQLDKAGRIRRFKRYIYSFEYCIQTFAHSFVWF